MKRLLLLLLSISFLIALLPTMSIGGKATTYPNLCGDDLQWTLDHESGLLTIYGQGKMWDYGLLISWAADDRSPWAASYADVVKTIVIEEGVTSIGDYAFYTLTKLETVILPESLLSIGTNAFENCTKLTDITLPSKLQTIKRRAFCNCRSLICINVPASVYTINLGNDFLIIV